MVFSQGRIIHAGFIFVEKQGRCPILLRHLNLFKYVWFLQQSNKKEIETAIWGGIIGEAIAAARKAWKINNLSFLNCGFRYTLPERDEVGTNALFYQMVSSYSSALGVYFDEELGSNCIIQNASLEARLFSKEFLSNPYQASATQGPSIIHS